MCTYTFYDVANNLSARHTSIPMQPIFSYQVNLTAMLNISKPLNNNRRVLLSSCLCQEF